MSTSWSLALGLSWLGFGLFYEAALRSTLRRVRLPPTAAVQLLKAGGYLVLAASFVAFRRFDEALGIALTVALSVWSLVFTLGTLLAPFSLPLFRGSLVVSAASAALGLFGLARL